MCVRERGREGVAVCVCVRERGSGSVCAHAQFCMCMLMYFMCVSMAHDDGCSVVQPSLFLLSPELDQTKKRGGKHTLTVTIHLET